MSRALTPIGDDELSLQRLDREQVELLKRTVCKGADDDEFALFISIARRTGLDPFTRQIHAVRRYDRDAGREVMTMQVGIDGLRLQATRSGEYEGQDGPWWCGPDGEWREVWTDMETPPIAAKMVVVRAGRPYTGVAPFAEFVQKRKDGKPTRFWADMPCTMLAKCAEAQALRKAFPAECSGLYEHAEIGATSLPAAPDRTIQMPRATEPETGDVETTIIELTEQSGKTKGREWHLYSVVCSNGTTYRTFSSTIADVARAFAGTGEVVVIQSEPTDKGPKLVGVSAADQPED